MHAAGDHGLILGMSPRGQGPIGESSVVHVLEAPRDEKGGGRREGDRRGRETNHGTICVVWMDGSGPRESKEAFRNEREACFGSEDDAPDIR